MALSKHQFSQYIKDFNFRELFNDMGWNNDRTTQSIIADDYLYNLSAVAEKSGFKVLLCNPCEDGRIPEYNIRKKIEIKVTKLFQEHLIIYHDRDKKQQIWQLVVRQTGKPTKMTETRYHITQDPELLYQRASGLFFTLDEEEKITIVDVTQRVVDNFQQNNERVTKHFYDRFKKEHTTFLSFISGIDDKINNDWYASLMLNRLMFCYFIQKKGFLDNNKNYLRNKLTEYQNKKGENRFFSFYRQFLLILFHNGLGAPNHNDELKKEIGIIPYLNGGLFDEHELENLYKGINIEDKAFEKIFNFFDEYEWHLDTRFIATGKDINPDVIGYIFEKYVNDRAQMGAYYTKEDITDYISKNCIIPFLFDETKRHYPEIFLPDGEIWSILKENGDKYIYDAVKYGVSSDNIYDDLPKVVHLGLEPNQPELISKRKPWNISAPDEIALPTENWREIIYRRERYIEIKRKIQNGDINTINDFIVYNLNIKQFAQDVIENVSDYKFIEYFYKALSNISILDPTCGSAAFLFAAMNILEPLYEGCLQRMENFITESINHNNEFFKTTISHIHSQEHSNIKYFIFKSIILQNLYGVDIMREAVEIAKLRLFLKLVATVDADYLKPNLGLEPLPDIDFNIRVGNSLVGFATEEELQKGLRYTLDGLIAEPIIQEKCSIVAEVFNQYKKVQLIQGADFDTFKKGKVKLKKHLDELNHELNHLLHKQASGIEYNYWVKTHQPFHWFAEFYETLHEKGGFDVVIGNPPYVEYAVTRKSYQLTKGQNKTEKAGNLFAYLMEKSHVISNSNGKIGMILPLSAFCTERMEVMNDLFSKYCSFNYISFFGFRPAKLFEGANRTIGIGIYDKTNLSLQRNNFYTTSYYKWTSEYRVHLFETINYFNLPKFFIKNQYPKIGCPIENEILKKIFSKKKTVAYYSDKTKKLNCIYYRNVGGLYWKIITNFPPKFYENGKESASSRETHLFINSSSNLLIILALLNSNLYWYYYNMTSDCWSLNPSDLISVPIDIEELSEKQVSQIITLCQDLMTDLDKNACWAERIHKGKNSTRFQQFTPRLSKSIIDEIDKVFGEHYKFSQEELDFIINYDTKYRMGRELENGEEELTI